jgi:hypothetical protein
MSRYAYHQQKARDIAKQMSQHGTAPHRVRAWAFHTRRALEWLHFVGAPNGR